MKPEKRKPLLDHGGTMGVPNGSKGTRPRKPLGLQIAETKQHEIALRRANGESKTSIAKSLGMSRKTINRVLSQGEYQSIVQLGRSRLAELVPRAGDVLKYFLNTKRKGRLPDKAADVALAILTGLQVFVPKSRTDIAAAQPNKYEGWTKEQILEYIQTGKPNEEEF